MVRKSLFGFLAVAIMAVGTIAMADGAAAQEAKLRLCTGIESGNYNKVGNIIRDQSGGIVTGKRVKITTLP